MATSALAEHNLSTGCIKTEVIDYHQYTMNQLMLLGKLAQCNVEQGEGNLSLCVDNTFRVINNS